MDHAARYRAARDRLAAGLARALGEVPPDIAESALGRVVLAEALVGEALALLGGDADAPAARAIVARVAAALPAGTGQDRGLG